MKLSEIELDFLYEKSAELFRDKVKQRGEDYEHVFITFANVNIKTMSL